ncbi:MAG: hypothetical protein FWC16_05320 [Defluviitaleaceae bacterium]|nr:hypothetical protein [Defluviitaleaceae bacterium]MCL2274328.1 hypothetical protein [Defluviitaleaceae bacterium]
MRTTKNRKTHNRELERQKKGRARLAIGIFSLVVLAIIAGASWVAWDTHSRGWILRFEGTRIPTNEFRLLMDENAPEQKEAAMDDLIRMLTLIHRAEQHNAGLTEEELEFWAWLAEMNFGQFGPMIVPAERVGELLAAENGPIFERLRDIYAPEAFAIFDEDAFATEMAEYLANNLANYHATDIFYTMIEDEDAANYALARLRAGEATFTDIILEHTPWFHTEEGVPSMPLNEFIREAEMNDEQAAHLRSLQVGETSDIIMWGEEWGDPMHMLVYILEIEEADPDAVKRGIREERILGQRTETILQLIPQWVAAANYTKNERAFNLV